MECPTKVIGWRGIFMHGKAITMKGIYPDINFLPSRLRLEG
jgi:hypothetical protein